MYIHVFAFRWNSGTTEAQKQRVAGAVRALQSQVPELLETSVGTNLSPRGQGYAFIGVMKFADINCFEAYSSHPAHQALLAWLMPLIEPLELDFET